MAEKIKVVHKHNGETSFHDVEVTVKLKLLVDDDDYGDPVKADLKTFAESIADAIDENFCQNFDGVKASGIVVEATKL
jgi:hypothetical protein